MGKSSKKPRKNYDAKQFDTPLEKKKKDKDKDLDGDDIFKEMLRSKTPRR